MGFATIIYDSMLSWTRLICRDYFYLCKTCRSSLLCSIFLLEMSSGITSQESGRDIQLILDGFRTRWVNMKKTLKGSKGHCYCLLEHLDGRASGNDIENDEIMR